MTEIYIPTIPAPPGGNFADINIITLQDRIHDTEATHVRTTKGKIWPIFSLLNKKSVPLNNGGDGPQRITFKTVESFGIMQEAPAELVDEVKEFRDQGFDVEVDLAPGGGPANRVSIVLAAAVEEAKSADSPLPEAAEGAGEQEAPATTTQPDHQERAHAILSASGAHRWMNCPPSALLEADLPDTTSPAADQGTAAHELAEHKLRKHLKIRTERPTSQWQDDEMEELTDQYRDWVLGELAAARARTPDAQLFIEQRLDFSHLVPDGFGTGDATIISDGTLHIIDLKYGQGVLVEAEDNPQMKLYALGALNVFGMLYDITDVAMTVYQPRRDNISTAVISVEELEAWAETELKPAAQLAAKGEGQFAAGEWCGFCKLRSTCRARAEKNLEVAQFEFEPPVELTEDEIAEALRLIPEAKKWMADVEKYATSAAVDHGKQWPGFKVVAGRSIRKWTDEQAVADAASAAGYTDVWNRKLIGITDMEKLMGKPELEEVLGGLIVKPEGKPTLVPESDKRQALEVHTAETDFGPAA